MEEPITLNYAPAKAKRKWSRKRKAVTGLTALALTVATATNKDVINNTLGYKTGYYAFENLPNWDVNYSDYFGPQISLALRYKNNYSYGWVSYHNDRGFDSHLIIKDLSQARPLTDLESQTFEPRIWMKPEKTKSNPSS